MRWVWFRETGPDGFITCGYKAVVENADDPKFLKLCKKRWDRERAILSDQLAKSLFGED